ncbi:MULTISPECIES: sensor histidine kinase [Catenuloplanes]|uniref:histidine kinase n=1 Tax=Catenuloplanes niger TaxID=587534 RepID=A0AAE3ZIA3_9ACTN|nr:HAMP domain-containing sensor histidine kinase [Catenuloplanes niger]MDR7320467.1 two-component system sensor histidine kinase BaeS [Catenuloplanes niger]
MGVPLHRSILVRLLATSTLVAVCAVVGTAWLAVQTTTRAIQQQQGRSLAEDQAVYGEVLGFAATHRSWDGVDALLRRLAERTGHRIALHTEDRQPIAESAPGPAPAAGPPTATVDPLRVNGAREIDPRATGPYRLPDDERQRLREQAQAIADCVAELGVPVRTSERPTGRTDLVVPADAVHRLPDRCAPAELEPPTPTEKAALGELATRVLGCLGDDPARPEIDLYISVDFTTDYRTATGRTVAERDIADCVAQGREEQLRPHTAPPALLFITDPAAGTRPEVFSLSRDNLVRITLVTGAVLAVTVAVTVLAGLRLVRPLRALTEAAGAPLSARPMPVTGRDEIGRLATVLNDLADRRERAERQRKEMINDIAHELRNPMTNIRSWLEAAEDGVTPADARLLALLLDETSQLSRILDDLRDLAAADAGTLRIHPEPIRLGDVLGPAADAHRGAAENGGVRLRTGFDPEMTIVADPVRMRQVTGNLLSNAIRHTPPGGTVALRAGPVGTDLVVMVTDTGTGIAPADLPHVFDRFWRADPSRRRGTGGSGLGLAIVRDLVGAHHGSVDAVSALGSGTTVTVRIPIRTA